MYKKLISFLKEKGVIIEKGLSKSDIIYIEKEYEISFPEEWKQLYSIGLPISKGFYNWRNNSSENIKYIKEIINTPVMELSENTDDIDWCEEWGEEPTEIEKRRKIINEKLRSAPKIIPIYSHRYLACIETKQNPIFSICGTDVVYYGENLLSYFEIEFGSKEYNTMNYENISYIPFWSDMI
ncbi:hypothetical protein [Lachnotalea glycerini]|uniref:SMI1/KNR4 family protein n=1 Tax=Lachnotalea glycerini TaxID=1763509 RepID=A0A371J2L2_9FIRM|nr:hypothetical protein [Lachnotalea glycerini]RDY26896.1 hypothetical protein CG710_021325 [Lachnotalea glycerini]